MLLRLAVAVLFPVLSLFPQNAPETFEDLAARASEARDANDVPRAITLYQQALRKNDQWAEGWLYFGTLLYDADQYPGCKAALTRFVAMKDDVAPAWGFLGLCEFETGDYSPALVHIQKSLALKGNDDAQMLVVLRFHEAMLLARAGQFDQAIEKYMPFVRDTNASPTLLAALGIAALHAPIVPKEIAPDRQDLFQTAGKAAFFTVAEQHDQAEPAYQDLLTRYPAFPGVHYMHGFFLLTQSPSQAIAEFERELAVDPSNARSRAMLAWALLNRRDSGQALPYAARAANDAPQVALSQFVYGRALVETGETVKGIAHLEQALKLEPASLETHLALATAYSKAGRTAEARTERQRSVELAKGAAPASQH